MGIIISQSINNFSFPATATYDFLAIEAASDDKVMDVLFILKMQEGNQNYSCANAGIKCSLILM